MYKVYMHVIPNGKKYIGITKLPLNRRWDNGRGYKTSPLFSRAIKKYGWDNIKHIVLFDNLTKEEAEQKEIELIKEYNTTNPNKGYNIDNGGKCIGTHSEATREKIRASHFGKKQTNEEKEKHRLISINLWKDNEFREKMKKAHKQNAINHKSNKERYRTGKAVICIETQKIFPRIIDASEYYEICDETIRKCCHKKRFTAGGYHWEFYKESDSKC